MTACARAQLSPLSALAFVRPSSPPNAAARRHLRRRRPSIKVGRPHTRRWPGHERRRRPTHTWRHPPDIQPRRREEGDHTRRQHAGMRWRRHPRNASRPEGTGRHARRQHAGRRWQHKLRWHRAWRQRPWRHCSRWHAQRRRSAGEAEWRRHWQVGDVAKGRRREETARRWQIAAALHHRSRRQLLLMLLGPSRCRSHRSGRDTGRRLGIGPSPRGCWLDRACGRLGAESRGLNLVRGRTGDDGWLWRWPGGGAIRRRSDSLGLRAKSGWRLQSARWRRQLRRRVHSSGERYARRRG